MYQDKCPASSMTPRLTPYPNNSPAERRVSLSHTVCGTHLEVGPLSAGRRAQRGALGNDTHGPACGQLLLQAALQGGGGLGAWRRGRCQIRRRPSLPHMPVACLNVHRHDLCSTQSSW